MPIIQREEAGYSQATLASFYQGVLYEAPPYGSLVPVRGVCFATGHKAKHLAMDFLGRHLGLGIIDLDMRGMTAAAWRETHAMLTAKQTVLTRIGILLSGADQVEPALEEAIIDTMENTVAVGWFATARNPDALPPKLRLCFLVFLGLGQAGRMRFLISKDQHIMMDKGSMRKAGQ